MGYGGGGGAASFLDLLDTPATYAGQALKLAKVNAGETALSLDFLLSFTDWYAGGAPTSYPWVFEAQLPFTPPNTHTFSPILKDAISGEYYVYITGDVANQFYKYNLTTKQYQKLANPPATPGLYLSMPLSPDETKLALKAAPASILQIYDIETNTWTSSPAAPQISGNDSEIFGVVWADNDTIWCQMRAYVVATFTVKMFRYVVSTTTWTQFTNSITPGTSNATSMSIKGDGTALYAGNVGTDYYYLTKYVIATDTYSNLSLGSTGRRFIASHDRNARLWWRIDGTNEYYYWNCETEAISGVIFPANPQEDTPGWRTGGFYGTTGAIIWARAAAPKNMSYMGTGYWRLASKVLTDYNLVVFKKPADGYAILAIDQVNNFTVPIYIFSTLALPAGTWEFFYPKDGDYTKLKISGSELK